jgi:uncharacterized protein (AIM24 family)
MARLTSINGKMIEATIAPGERLYARKGAMLAYTGEVAFSPSGTGGQSVGGFVGRMVAGEQVPLMISEGAGTVLYGHAGLQTKIVELGGQQLSVEADKLLLYDGTLQAGTQFLAQNGGLRAAVQGQLTGQGLFTTVLSGAGSAVLLSHGPVFEIPVGGQPVAVDPQAYVGHKGAVDVKLEANVSWRDAVGKGSGEAFQLKLTGSGTVYIQASEARI